MNNDIDRALALAGESNFTNVWWPNDIDEGRTLLRKLARRLQASEARVAELEEAIEGVSDQLDTFINNPDDCIEAQYYIKNVNSYLKDELTK